MSILYSQVADKTVANTTAETSLLTTAPVFAANSLVAGSVVRVMLAGVWTAKTTPGTLRLRMKCDTDPVIDTGANTAIVAASAVGWTATGLWTIRTAGAGGTYVGWGGWMFYPTATSGTPWHWNNGAGAVDTTASRTIDVTAQWSTADVLNSIIASAVVIELVTGAG